MTPRRHPDETALLAYTLGGVPPGGSLVLGAHLSRCARCRAAVRFLEAIGGAVLDAVPPDPMRTAGAAVAGALDPAFIAPHVRPALDRATRATAGFPHGPWKPFLPGVEVADVEGDFEAHETVCLLKGRAGSPIPEHTHGRMERFIVLEGQFGLDRTVYHAGDYIEADASVTHTPFIPPTGDCLCLFALEGGLIFTSPPGDSASA